MRSEDGEASGCHTGVSGTRLSPALLCPVTDWGQHIKRHGFCLPHSGSASSGLRARQRPAPSQGLGWVAVGRLPWDRVQPSLLPLPYPAARS